MEKLELKHLSGYLPYGLNIEFERCIYPRRKEKEVLNPKHLELSFYGIKNNFKIKPILRPLSDLTKEIEVNGEKFVPLAFIRQNSMVLNYIQVRNCFKYNNGDETFRYVDIYYLPYIIIEKLYEWHFDIHGLIEKGLAIDINTL